IPDLVNMAPFEFRINPLDHIVSPASDKWLEASGTLATKKMKMAQKGLNAGLLGSMCWPDIQDKERLQVCADFVNYLFHLDDLTDEMDAISAGVVREAVIDQVSLTLHVVSDSNAADSMWLRICRTATPLVQRRFRDTLEEFFVAIMDEAIDRKKKVIRGVQDYIIRRRANGAVRPCFVLIEYANGFELPESVWHHPIIRDLQDWADDLVSWANGGFYLNILSFGVEYSRGDTSNIVMSVMHEQGLGVQDAMNTVGKMFDDVVQNYLAARAALPSWGPEVDRNVQVYLQGLEYWIIGSTEWCFWTQRYF
ncbi:terpenoid synthase, partial [Dacryopinax primogenitus]